MKYPYIQNNDLVLVDYLPGSSGQLLMRLWSELDIRMEYTNNQILSETSITDHRSTREIEYDILLPKRLTNWFLDKCDPVEVGDYAFYFDLLGTTLTALTQKWTRGKNSLRFYQDDNYSLSGYCRIYGIHTWSKLIPWRELTDLGYNIKCISIIPKTKRGLQYQISRCSLCYPVSTDFWKNQAEIFNSKPTPCSFDFCTALVDQNTDEILSWIKDSLGNNFRQEKVEWTKTILEVYYREIVYRMEEKNV